MSNQNRKTKVKSNRLKKAFYVFLGSIFLFLGAIGIIIPLLPTTPFLLLSAACYYKGSKRMHNWIQKNRIFGEHIRNYKEGRGMLLKTKVITITILWASISYTALFIIQTIFIQIILITIAAGVTIHLLKIPTYKKSKKLV